MSQLHISAGNENGVYLLGGQAEDSEQYSSQVLYFEQYTRFVKKCGMRKGRAFFPIVYFEYDHSLYVFGGRNHEGDMAECEKYNILMNRWFNIKNLPTARNGSSAVVID